MSTADHPPIDTRDMLAVHAVFRRAFADAPNQLEAAEKADAVHNQQLAAYFEEVLWLLHAHHAGEDEILYPLLVERQPEHEALFARMDTQHTAISSALSATDGALKQYQSSGSGDSQALKAAFEPLHAVMAEHFDEEEAHVLPIASRTVSPPEWGALPAHALSSYAGDRVWLPFGLVLEAMPDDVRATTLAHVPPPVTQMWTGGGADAFAKEMAQIRGNN